jgi:hypothetical protein
MPHIGKQGNFLLLLLRTNCKDSCFPLLNFNQLPRIGFGNSC